MEEYLVDYKIRRIRSVLRQANPSQPNIDLSWLIVEADGTVILRVFSDKPGSEVSCIHDFGVDPDCMDILLKEDLLKQISDATQGRVVYLFRSKAFERFE